MDKIFVIRELSSLLYLGEESLVGIEDALEFDNIDDVEDILATEVYQTGYYEIITLYYVDAEQRKEDEEYQELQEHIHEMKEGIKQGMRIQNGEGTNWVGYFKYKPEYKEKIESWFNHNEIDFNKLKNNKYYKVTGWDKSVEEVTYDYIAEHIRQYTLETRYEWIHTKLY